MERQQSLLSQGQDSEKIQLFVSCRNLADLDFITVTDSFLIIKLNQPNKKQRQILKTKVYSNDLNPNYAQSVVIDFFFQIKQKLTFQVYHQSKPPKLVGKLESSLGQIFGSPANGLIKPLKNNKNQDQGKIIIRCEKVHTKQKRNITLQIKANNLPSFTYWWFFGATRPFFRVFRKRHTDELLIYQSEAGNSTTQTWKQFSLSESKLCKNDDKMKFQIRYYNYSNNGNHTLIGSSFLSVSQLQNIKQFQVKNKQQKKGNTSIIKFQRKGLYDFGDYIQNGLQLALTTCIDFTASNGLPKSTYSLHYIRNNKTSAYEEALSEVLEIILDYDFDKLVPTYGFGAKVEFPTFNSGNKVHHCFPLNGSAKNPNLFNKQGIMKAYRNALDYLTFSGPTNFGGLLQVAIQQCKEYKKDHKQYMIVFILTDGQIHDRQRVIDQIVECNKLPMSIIIVGIGDGDFSIMHELDDDNCQIIDSKGNCTIRDLVQFVEFKKFKNNSVQLARQVLEELPRQVSQYFALMNIKPQQIKGKQIMTDLEMQKQFFNSKMMKKDEQNKQNPYGNI